MIIKPNLQNSKLTRKINGFNENLCEVNIDVIEEKPLTLYLNNQEIVTMMTIGDYPDFLAIGYLLNQQMISLNDKIEAIDFDSDLDVVVVRTNKKTNYEKKLKKKNYYIWMRSRNPIW